jgi:hypothetical protein
MDESLRRRFKIRRDVNQRGHALENVLAALENRAGDARRFIQSQASHADLVFSLQPVQPAGPGDSPDLAAVKLKLVVRSGHILYEQMLRRILVGILGLGLDVGPERESGEIVLSVEGDLKADDVALAAGLLCPDMLDFLDVRPLWRDGLSGVMQLVVLAHINQTLRKQLL